MKNQTHFLSGLSLFWVASNAHADLVAHYQFDEPSAATTALNEIPGGDTGSVGIAVTTGVTGISGNAYSFGGATATQDDIVDMGNALFFSDLESSGAYSFSAWIKTADTTGNRNTAVFAGNDSANNVYADLGVAAAQAGAEGSASARNRPVGAGGIQQTGIFSTPAVAPVNDDQWHHLVMTVDTATARLALYVDGVLTNTQTMGTSALPVFNNFEVGRLGRSSPVDPFEGLIDDVQVYDEALTLEQVNFLNANPGQALSVADSDNDGLDDTWELFYFGNTTSQAGADLGPDADGATNLQEQTAGTNPTLSDTDEDGRTDGEELNTAPLTDPLDPDSDDDTLSDGDEVNIHGTNPNNSDSDDDSLPDSWEIANGLNAISDVGDNGEFGDPDSDLLTNAEEYNLGDDSTDPKNADSDNDGYRDNVEDRFGSWLSVDATGTSPNNADSDGDGIPDGQENPDSAYVAGVTTGTDPNLLDSDLDGFNDLAELNFGSNPTDGSSIPEVAKGLVAHYKFDEPASATQAASALGNSPGTVGSDVTTGVTGIAGNAYQLNNLFEQNDIVDMGNAAFLSDLIAGQAITLTTWVKSSDTSSGRNVAVSIANNTLTNSYLDMGIAATEPEVGPASARIRPNGDNDITEIFSNTDPNNVLVNDETWHHLAMTLDFATTTIRIFVDGVQTAENDAVAATGFPVFNNFEVGRLGRRVPTDAYAGLIDDLQVYNEALSPARIAQLYNMPGISADEDQDRLDDQWEIDNFGSITAQDGFGDPDGDNISNEEEETAGTSPIGEVRVLAITSIDFTAGNDFTIAFTGQPNTSYEVKQSSSLDEFASFATPIIATTDASGNGTALIPSEQASTTKGFFRLESL